MENEYEKYVKIEIPDSQAENIPNGNEYSGNPFGEPDYGLCRRCGRRAIDRSENPESILCRDCREELIRLKIPPFFYFIGIGVIFLMVFTLVTSMGGFQKFGSYNNAESLADDGYVLTALDELLDILEDNPDNKNTAIKLTDIGMKYAYYDYAAYAINNYLVGKEVSDYQYDKIDRYITKLEAYYASYDLYEEIWEELFDETMDIDDTYDFLSDFRDELSKYLGNSSYDQALLYYYLGYMSTDDEERIAYLEECININPYYYDAQAQIATYYRRQGDLAKARQQLEGIYEINKEDSSVLRSFATLELVEGNLEQGLDYAVRAYEMYPEGDYVIDTYIIALAANGQNEEAWNLVSEYEEEYLFDDDLYDFLNGNMTLEEYYIGE